MRKVVFTLFLSLVAFLAMADNTVTVTYDGTTATVVVDDNISPYVTVAQSGAHVSITQSASVNDAIGEITYSLTGTSTDGEFYMSGSYKATVELNGLTLTNSTPVYSGAAVHIQDGKRINVKVVTGTTNTLADAATGSQKGCLYVKGHAEFKQKGTLNIVGNLKHGIKAGEYISIKNATININSAVGDGISCNEYFLMESGAVTIKGTGDDGIQCDIDGTASTGMIEGHEDEDSGNVYVSGGTITITCDAVAAKGIKCAGDAYISNNAVINVTTTGKGEWDETDLETNAACGLSADGDINISGGTITLTATGSGGKGMKCDYVLNISGGDIRVSTTGGLYYNNGTTENTNYTGNTDNVNNSYYSSAKGIKAGYKDESGSTTICYGGINITGGTVYVTTQGRNAEGIESKNYLNVRGGETTIDAYDDGINAAQDLIITDGYLYSRSSNNDGIDANGNVVIEGGLIYAIGSQSPEVAIDANTEENKKFYFNGGVLIAVGDLESGSNLSQTCYQSSSCSSNTWYSLTYGSNVIAFLTPTISSGGGGFGPGGSNSSKLVVSAPSTPTVKKGVTVGDGTPVFYGPKCYLDATVTGGSTVSLTQYSSGGGGWNPGGGSSSSSYNVTASANPTAGGSVTGAGSYTAYTLCALTATANTGYTFNNWTRNGSVASTDATYSFYVSEAATCVANFTLNTFDIAAKAIPEEGGAVTGAGTYGYGTTCTLTATANEGYTFVNWTVDNEEVSTDAVYSFTVTESKSVGANFRLDAVSHTFTLRQGWSWWSTYIEMNGVNGLELLENELGENGIQIKAQNAFVTYDEGWFGGLNTIENEKSYHINMNEPGDFSITGTLADPEEHTITYTTGWNWLGYVEDVTLAINDALANLSASENNVFKSYTNFATYYDGYGWWGDLESLAPGQGYMMQASSTGSFKYPANAKASVVNGSNANANKYWKPVIGKFETNMNVMAVVERNGQELRSETVEVGAFAADGECRGSAKLLYVAPIDRYVAFLTVYGDDGDPIVFRLLDGEDVAEAAETMPFVSDGVVGSSHTPLTLHFGGTGVADEGETALRAYPNPSKGGFVVEGQGMERLEVYDMLGELLLVEEACPDTHTLNLNGFAEGMYHLRVLTQNGYRHLSVVVAR